uniref:Uncharacterized protein n=1 Tax=Pyramimonas obovata TaxID=1411642 RepID=A0A7S0WTQ0_9CHLO|mmetsp:Transcript_39490/g.85977  ORF Transcript_39490/g.85977 Transcript_39490/m.85977 type:complete len:356 (+) Transcript_39490:184-1251(+)|eukprot:CAMPEP_0118932888 /NCGR_PEP_ID=MMETSP1169-20130426/10672_1 /TAXON_ID=36882 /ORGANISM="Pyramimonas obovata, Strain CCMP722" /LENGTH=355 /DNA_ID=CAMNT_0006875593 /DNA_START=178 /DNA_END=1245 /DNA_ORIENTATION=+
MARVEACRPVVHWEPSIPLDADECEKTRRIAPASEEASTSDEEETLRDHAHASEDQVEIPRNRGGTIASSSSCAQNELDVRAVFLHIRNKAEASEFEPYPHLRLRSARRECRLEVNGEELGFSEPLVNMLKRERAGCYICMESFRVAGELTLEILCEEERMMLATLKPPLMNGRTHSRWTSWILEFRPCDTYARSRSSPIAWTAELSIVGQVNGQPICLADTVLTSLQQKRPTRSNSKSNSNNSRANTALSLEVIAEGEKEEESRPLEPTGPSDGEKPLWDPQMFDPTLFERTYSQLGERGEQEVGQITWFSAGVRMGMGMGLGVCLGVGLGIGILARAYQRTSTRVSELKRLVI